MDRTVNIDFNPIDASQDDDPSNPYAYAGNQTVLHPNSMAALFTPIYEIFDKAAAAGRGVRVYVSGPMTGIQEFNFPAFKAATALLRQRGYEVLCPTEIEPNLSATWHECLRGDIKAICDVDMLVLLPGWENSKGAHLEVHIAHRLGIGVISFRDLEQLHTIRLPPAAAATQAYPQPTTVTMVPLSRLATAAEAERAAIVATLRTEANIADLYAEKKMVDPHPEDRLVAATYKFFVRRINDIADRLAANRI